MLYKVKCTHGLTETLDYGTPEHVKGELSDHMRDVWYNTLEKSVKDLENVSMVRTQEGFDLFAEIEGTLCHNEIVEGLTIITEDLYLELESTIPLSYTETWFMSEDGDRVTERHTMHWTKDT